MKELISIKYSILCLAQCMCSIWFSRLYKEEGSDGHTGENNHLDAGEDEKGALCPLVWLVWSAGLRGAKKNGDGAEGVIH